MEQANREVHMENNAATKRLLERMFKAALKERFSQFARRREPELFARTWARIVKKGGIKSYLTPWEWDSPMKIVDALDSLDDYCDSVEAMIQEHDKREKGKRKIL